MSKDFAARHAAHVSAVVREGTDGPSVETRIALSWTRCMENYRIDPGQTHHTLIIERRHLLEHQERLEKLLEIACFEINNLYQHISRSGFAFLLADNEGVIIKSIIDPSLIDTFTAAGLWMGALWSERHEGTNAIGTCLIEGQPVIVHRDEHFRIRNTGLTCSASPIFDPHSNLIAVLDASSVNSQDSKKSQFHALALTSLAAKLIENSHFISLFRNSWVLQFHTRAEYVSLPSAGLLAFDGDGRILAANQAALNQLGCTAVQQLTSDGIGEIFDIRLDNLMGRARHQPTTVWPVYDRRGKRSFAMLRCPESHVVAGTSLNALDPIRTPEPLSLEGLESKDPLMVHNVACARRVMNRNISILLAGETGTGKEAFSRAIHMASHRASKPFVAVNCASIPENLIESELFGYKHGAFTGARREGLRGKISQASGGTLFLDEIGDMPAHLQTRLLRVLEEKEVLPLGSETPIPVDLHVISATHCNLREKVALGQFREDLYYRLNGITLTLPPLRERADRALLINAILAAESGDSPVEITQEAFRALNDYDWPGNIRQLRNVLRTAVALCEHGVIQLQDLPAEIIQVNRYESIQQPHLESETQGEDALSRSEKETLLRVLDQHRWHITNTSAFLGLSRNTLYRKMKKHGIKIPGQN